MIITLLYIVFFVSCVLLIGTVLVQPGKSDAGALFTSSVSSTAFGPRGTQSILSRVTIGAAITFMLSALLLAMPALRGEVSIMQTGTTTTATPTPATDANSNSNAAGANGANAADTNSANTNAANPAASETNANSAPAANANK